MRFLTCCLVLSSLCATPAFAQSAADCHVDDKQRAEARKLNWQQFDQRPGGHGSFRALASKGCYSQAFEAYVDWLQNGPGFQNTKQRGVGVFHMGQALGFVGNEKGAVELIRQAYREETDNDPNAREWNLYVDGVLAFFAKDRDGVKAAIGKLEALGTAPAQQWLTSLAGLRRCGNKSYREAMSPACRPS